MALQFRENTADFSPRDSSGALTAEGQGYCPHIDVLRALAILPVVLYHLLPRWCPGGYAGVDVFFVISGFLITRGIVDGLRTGQFSIRSFYVKRIKRIVPTYVAVVLFTLAAFLPRLSFSDYSSLCRTAMYSVGYSTNIYFAKVVGYFDLDARLNPLLHLWSLGVEEQFYLLIPALIFILWKMCGARFWFFRFPSGQKTCS